MIPIERLDRALAYVGSVIKVYTDRVKLPGGLVSNWDFIGHVGGAAVLPVMEDGRILLVRQYRNALDRFTLELPAGKRDAEDEDYELCAARELEEETGYRCEHLERMLTLTPSVAFSNEVTAIYLAEHLVKSERHLDEEEDIEVEVWTLEELMDMIRAGLLTDAKTVSAILAYQCRQKRQNQG